MNNEPVAWMSNEYSVCSKEAYQTLSKNARSWYPIPLYTHPANAYQSITDTKIEPTVVSYTHPVNTCKHGVDDGACKECYLEATHPAELTDEEIFSIAIDCTYGGDLHADKFARAILRKAREQ